MNFGLKNNIELSGIYSTISNNSVINIQNNYVSSNIKNTALYINSKINCYNNKTAQHCRYHFTAANNSRISIQDYEVSGYSSKLSYNTITNFPAIHAGSSVTSFNTHGILKFNNNIFSLTVVDNENNIIELHEFNWSRNLINDGTCFKFIKSNDARDILYPYKIISFNIYQNDQLTQELLDQLLLSYIPKDLHQSKLYIKITNHNIFNKLNYNLQKFFNGKVQVFNDNNQTYTDSSFKFNNCETVQIYNLYLSGNYYERLVCPISITDIQSIIILNSSINNIINTDSYKDYINSLSNFEYKYNIVSDMLELYKYGVTIEISTSNLVLKNNYFNKQLLASDFKNLFTIVADKNSTVKAIGNKFYLNQGKNINKRPILYYSAANSNIISIDEKVIFKTDSSSSSEQELTNTLRQNNIIWKSLIYGYALPGAIFNHNHSQHILKIAETSGMSHILWSFPIGSIYYDTKAQTKYVYFPPDGETYSNQFISHKIIDSKTNNNMKLGLTQPNVTQLEQSTIFGVSADLTHVTFNKQKYSDKYLFPSNESIYNYNSKYYDNLFYFQTYYSINRTGGYISIPKGYKNVFDLHDKCNKIVLSDFKTYNDFFDININDNIFNTKLVLKYSMFSHYNKENSILKDNKASLLRKKREDQNN